MREFCCASTLDEDLLYSESRRRESSSCQYIKSVCLNFKTFELSFAYSASFDSKTKSKWILKSSIDFGLIENTKSIQIIANSSFNAVQPYCMHRSCIFAWKRLSPAKTVIDCATNQFTKHSFSLLISSFFLSSNFWQMRERESRKLMCPPWNLINIWHMIVIKRTFPNNKVSMFNISHKLYVTWIVYDSVKYKFWYGFIPSALETKPNQKCIQFH